MRYTNYRKYLEQQLGCRAQKVTINAGLTCPNRDGKISVGGCTFCRNDAFTPSYCSPEKNVRQQIDEGILFHHHRYARSSKYLAYFQSFSNTYAPLETLRQIYAQALSHPDVIGLVIGTRPDCVDNSTLDLFADIAQKGYYVIIEYGVESVYDQTLLAINRGHNFACAQNAIRLTADKGLHVGAHFIIGLPGETRQMILQSVDQINALPLNTIKFHQLQLFRDTPMAAQYALDPLSFNLFSLDDYLDLFADILERLRPDIVVERFSGEAPPRYHAIDNGWGRIRNERLVQLLDKRLEERNTEQGAKYKAQ